MKLKEATTLNHLRHHEEGLLLKIANLKLATLGCPTIETDLDEDVSEITKTLIARRHETQRLLGDYRCPSDQRIERFLARYLELPPGAIRLPGLTLDLDRPGLARTLSLPQNQDSFKSSHVSSFRVRQGVLHNPRADRRTTKGTFHVAEGGLPIPADKLSVPRAVFARLLTAALAPPRELLRLPITSTQKEQAECFASLLIRPIVCPEVPGFISQKSLELRFFAPGGLVSNLDFVESIFGNAGDPWLPENDAGLDVEHWTGHTGCVILAPHLVTLRKKDLGLPPVSEATDRQRRDEMCWRREDELYNDGEAFKVTARDASGVILTLIADNYFGYCKKEVKTQISFSANLHGLCEEEHSGGALVFPGYDLGQEFSGELHVRQLGHSYEEMISLYGSRMHVKAEGFAIDRRFPDIVYVSESARFDLRTQRVSWQHGGRQHSLPLQPSRTYVRPSGYKIQMKKVQLGRAWTLVGTVAEGLLCHKPCTVSGGGKSEISKPVSGLVLQGPVFVSDYRNDFEQVNALLRRDYSSRFLDPAKNGTDLREILSPERSLGSVIKLFTPSQRDFNPDYNAWLESIPQHIKELLFVLKSFYKPEWKDDWTFPFSVNNVNGRPGHELRFQNLKVLATYLRVGMEPDGTWRTFGLRKDFHPALKLQMADDITATVVVPTRALPLEGVEAMSAKFLQNCEYRLFQRPDEAIHRGIDRRTEEDLSRPGNFLSNFEPLEREDARRLSRDVITFEEFSRPMRKLIEKAADSDRPHYFVSSAHPRVVDGKPSKNPRYLQDRQDLVSPRDYYLAEMGMRLVRRMPPSQPLAVPVRAVLPGRRNNPPQLEAGVRALAVCGPIHYLELPELFIEYISSITGKSPSTTGAGSEGALTKGPFNALPPIIDLDNALVSALLCGHNAFLTSTAHVGPNARVDHDISFLAPEVWCKMSPSERDPAFLIEDGYLERCQDFEHEGELIRASRLGYRITKRFVKMFLGRVFNHPHVVFTDEMLRPELQSLEVFVEGMRNIMETDRRVAALYFEDGSVERASPPLRALLHIMKDGHHDGHGIESPEVRRLFTLEWLLASDWYATRLRTQQERDVELWRRHVAYLEEFLKKPHYEGVVTRLQIQNRLDHARATLARVSSSRHLEDLQGTLGAHPL